LNDKVIKAYLASFDSNLRIPYLEKKTTIDDLTIIASIYKSRVENQFYCLAVIVNNGEYLFTDVAQYSRYYKSDEIIARDVAQDTIEEIKTLILFRKRLLTFISNNPKLPSVLSVAFHGTLMVYYAVEGKLKIARLQDGELVINLPSKEQVYLTDLLAEFKIKVRRVPVGVPYNNGLI